MEEELPSTSDKAKAGNIELQEIMKNVARSTEDLITHLDNPLGDLFKHPSCELLGLDKELRNISDLLKVEMMIKAHLEEHIEREKWKLSEIKNNSEYNDGIREDIMNRIKRLNDDLKVRQESINPLKGRLTNQMMGIKETITKVLNRDISLAEWI